jgi:hypothetical protein
MSGIERYPDQFDLTAALPSASAWAWSRSCSATAPTTCSTWRRACSSRRDAPRCFRSTPSPSIRWRRCRPAANASSCRRSTTATTSTPCCAAIRRHAHRLDRQPEQPDRQFPAGAQVKAFLQAVPAHVVRGARRGLQRIPAAGRPCDTLAWVKEFPNLVVTRTFSKIYGLAGLRVGYAVTVAEVAT